MEQSIVNSQKVDDFIKLIKEAEYVLQNPEIYMQFLKQRILDSYSLN